MKEVTTTQNLITQLGCGVVAFLTDAPENVVKEWKDGSASPNIDQLETIVFTWSLRERLLEHYADHIETVGMHSSWANNWIIGQSDRIRAGDFNKVSQALRLWMGE